MSKGRPNSHNGTKQIPHGGSLTEDKELPLPATTRTAESALRASN